MGNERLEIASESCYDCGGSQHEVTSTMIGQLRVFGVHMTRTEGESSQGCGRIEKERTPRRLVLKKNLSLPFPVQQVASADSHMNTYDLAGRRKPSLCKTVRLVPMLQRSVVRDRSCCLPRALSGLADI
jgi:hypothetical protein